VVGWAVDIIVGGLTGAVVGAILAVNVVIFSGIEDGYEASPGDVFEQNMIAGVLVVASLVAAPVFGVVALRRLRRSRTKPKRPDQPVSSA
jgi:hypothetical protein